MITYYLNFNGVLERVMEIWKGATDNNKAFGTLLTDLSKDFDCLSHDLLIAKLHAYDIDIDSLNNIN